MQLIDNQTLIGLLQLAAIGQFAVAILNFNLVTIMNWQSDLAKVSTLVREVFQVHKWFISITLILFSVLSFRFPTEFVNGNNQLASWLAIGIGLFWGIRAVIQFAYYSSSHWKGKIKETTVHIILLICYGSCSILYLYCGIIK